MRRTVLGSVTAALILFAAEPAAAIQQEKVRATPANEQSPAAGGGFLAWTQYGEDTVDVFVKPPGEPAFKANSPNTFGFAGGIDGDRLAYQQAVGQDSDIKFMNLETRRRSNPPAGVNTPRWEYSPSVSGDFLLFARLFVTHNDREVVLFNLDTKRRRILDESGLPTTTLGPSQVNGNFATWTRFSRTACNVFVHDIEANRTRTIPNPGARCQYASSVGDDGTVYFVRSGFACGVNVEVRMDPADGPIETLIDFPDDRDAGNTFVVDLANGKDSVFYDPGRCTDEGSTIADIYRITVDPAA